MDEEVTQWTGKGHTPEHIARKLREADRLIADGDDLDAICQHLESSAHCS
jgi:hypothetical protein